MCLLFIALNCHSDYPIVLAANRDEYYDRPTRGLHVWDDVPNLLAGRDLHKGGTWFGVTRTGRWAAVTNFRERGQNTEAKSRGTLVSNYLTSDSSPSEYLRQLKPEAGSYNGFNLVVGDLDRALYFTNRHSEPKTLKSGVFGLSNHLLDSPWPKVEKGKKKLSHLLRREDLNTDPLFSLLTDRSIAPDETLPSTGVSLDMERLLSPGFINGEVYGTRSSTTLLINKNNRLKLEERSYYGAPEQSPDAYSSIAFEFEISTEPSTAAL
ncbi:MAG: NRDE family protein [Arenicellales bacterium]|nr:NRDE family protein [Arenicellales bacterium]